MFSLPKLLYAFSNVNVARFARNFKWDFFCNLQTLWKLAILKSHKMRLLKIPAFGVFSDAVKTVEVEERFSSVCISLSQFWAVGLQLSEVPSLLSSSSSNATSLLSFDKGAKFDDALWEEEGPPWGSSSSLTSSLQKENNGRSFFRFSAFFSVLFR